MAISPQIASDAALVEEVVTDATVDALNAALVDYEISPDRVIAVHYLEGFGVANGPGPRFRVLYWTQ